MVQATTFLNSLDFDFLQNNIKVSNKIVQTDEKTVEEYADFAQNIYDEHFNTIKPNTKEEFSSILNIRMQAKAGRLSDSDWMNKFNACNNLLSSLDIDSEFNKYLESRGCANEQELQALNKTPFRTVGELRRSAEARMMCSLSNLNKDKVPYAMSMSKELVSGVSIDNLGKYVKANVYEAAKMAQGFMQNYSGGSLNPQELLAVQREFSAYMNILENQEKEAQKHINPQDQLKRVDYSQYDDKYGEKYAQNLAINYETTKRL